MVNIDTLKKLVRDSKKLDRYSKLEALFLLDEATRSISIKDGMKIVGVLEKLYNEVTSEEYKDVLMSVIKRYKSEIRITSEYPGEGEMTLNMFLKRLNIPTEELPKELLDLNMKVGIDDGMGYSPTGFHDLLDAYLDSENGTIQIWV